MSPHQRKKKMANETNFHDELAKIEKEVMALLTKAEILLSEEMKKACIPRLQGVIFEGGTDMHDDSLDRNIRSAQAQVNYYNFFYCLRDQLMRIGVNNKIDEFEGARYSYLMIRLNYYREHFPNHPLFGEKK